MDVHVISLARSPDRLEAFQRSNAHLDGARIFEGIDGRALARQELIRDGVIAPDLDYSPGALGGALSHRALWRVAAGGGGRSPSVKMTRYCTAISTRKPPN